MYDLQFQLHYHRLLFLLCTLPVFQQILRYFPDYSWSALLALRLRIHKLCRHSNLRCSSCHCHLLYSTAHRNEHNDDRKLYLHSQHVILLLQHHILCNDLLYIHRVHKSVQQLHLNKYVLYKCPPHQSYLQIQHST